MRVYIFVSILPKEHQYLTLLHTETAAGWTQHPEASYFNIIQKINNATEPQCQNLNNDNNNKRKMKATVKKKHYGAIHYCRVVVF